MLALALEERDNMLASALELREEMMVLLWLKLLMEKHEGCDDGCGLVTADDGERVVRAADGPSDGRSVLGEFDGVVVKRSEGFLSSNVIERAVR